MVCYHHASESLLPRKDSDSLVEHKSSCASNLQKLSG